MSQNNARNYFKISQAALQLAKSTPDMKAQRQISIEISILFIYFQFSSILDFQNKY